MLQKCFWPISLKILQCKNKAQKYPILTFTYILFTNENTAFKFKNSSYTKG